VGIKLVMTDRTGKFGVLRALLEGLDIVVTLVTFFPAVIDRFAAGFALAADVMAGIDNMAAVQRMAAATARFFFSMVFLLS
jgi:hypothetical protein